jgi:hypothetical protein
VTRRVNERNSTSVYADEPWRDLDPYFSPPCAVESLIALEGDRLPHRVWEPGAGDCSGMATPLRKAGVSVWATDIYAYPEGILDRVCDYLKTPAPADICHTCSLAG